MRCTCCGRRYRSKAAHEQAMRWKAVHDDLRLIAKIPQISYSSTPAPDKHTRHAAASQAFRATGGT
jgi:hypothetical protein